MSFARIVSLEDSYTLSYGGDGKLVDGTCKLCGLTLITTNGNRTNLDRHVRYAHGEGITNQQCSVSQSSESADLRPLSSEKPYNFGEESISVVILCILCMIIPARAFRAILRKVRKRKINALTSTDQDLISRSVELGYSNEIDSSIPLYRDKRKWKQCCSEFEPKSKKSSSIRF